MILNAKIPIKHGIILHKYVLFDKCRVFRQLSLTSSAIFLGRPSKNIFNSNSIEDRRTTLVNHDNKHYSDNKYHTNTATDFTSTRHFANQPETIMNVFDRNAKRQQKNRTAVLPDYKVYEYIKEEIGWRVSDRICDVKRKFPVAVDLGCGRGYVSKHAFGDTVGTFYQCEMAEHVLKQSEVSDEVPTFRIHMDEEFLPFKHDSLDLVVSSLSLHWVNDLPGCFYQILNALKNDGCFIGSMFGGDTLYELRSSLHVAENEREGGIAAHISPFATAQDLGNLLHRAGFTMLTIDIDEMVIRYPSMFELMQDLKGMGENNCAHTRRLHLPRETQKLAADVYKDMYGSPDVEGVPATFQIIYFIGWKPDPSQPKAAKRGSGQVSLKDLDKMDQLAKEAEAIKKNEPSGGNVSELSLQAQKLASEIERLRASAAQERNDEDDDKNNPAR